MNISASYGVMFLYLVPYLVKSDRDNRKGWNFQKRYEQSYGTYLTEWMHDVNPSLGRLSKLFVKTAVKDVFDWKEYARKRQNRHKVISVSQDAIVTLISLCLIYVGDYSSIFILMMPTDSFPRCRGF